MKDGSADEFEGVEAGPGRIKRQKTAVKNGEGLEGNSLGLEVQCLGEVSADGAGEEQVERDGENGDERGKKGRKESIVTEGESRVIKGDKLRNSRDSHISLLFVKVEILLYLF